VAAHGFRRTFRGQLVLRTDEVERGLLADLVVQLEEFVAPDDDPHADPLARLVGIDPDAQRPDDPALARLFPDAYIDDDEAASEFRRFTERSLREGKLANARTVLDGLSTEGDTLTLTDDQAAAWLGTLNDLRLALGSRLDIQEDSHERFDAMADDDPAFAAHWVYDWLTYLQDSLIRALSGLDDDFLDPDHLER
jgi:hypothetical protein